MTYHSFCKINIGLEILRKRDDGYHDINTLFYRVNSPNDMIHISPSEEYLLKVYHDILPTDSSNLITRAFQACATLKKTEIPKLKIELQKNVPHGAGLGGGSANAAKAIEIFSDHIVPLTHEEKLYIASTIGADVPFFIQTSIAALASGKGDKLLPLSLVFPYSFLILKPKTISLSTAEAYRRISIVRHAPTNLLHAVELPLLQWKDSIVNDFEVMAFELYPQLRDFKQRLYDSGAEFALMSGSGSAFYAVYLHEMQARRAFELFTEDQTVEVFLSNHQ